MPPDEQRAPAGANGWVRAEMHVMAEMSRLSTAIDTLSRCVAKLDTRLGRVEVKAGVFGVLGGALTVAITLLVGVLK